MLTHYTVDNVRQAYAECLPKIWSIGDRSSSRNGDVVVMPGPVVTTYREPQKRVLLDAGRDANPFFHLMEAFWMLAGRNDVESLMRFNSGMKKYSDDGETFHGAYGYRWRHHFDQDGPLDQLAEIIRLLRKDPNDRRIVLQMWDPSVDLGMPGLDFPCNNLCYFRVRQVHVPACDLEMGVSPLLLDMTVVCRSNDMLWGGYGANAVHFSVLQEFVAAMVGARVGEMHQLSNNAHLYEATLPKTSPLPYTGYHEKPVPLFGDLSAVPVDAVYADLDTLWDDDPEGEVEHLPVSTIQLVGGMRQAWEGWKMKSVDRFFSGTEIIQQAGHEDWWAACVEWGHRRAEKFS